MSNIFRQLLKLLPQSPLMVATVQSVDVSNGTSVVAFDGGGTAVVRGASIVGGKCFIKDGEIRGAAPDLPMVEIEV